MIDAADDPADPCPAIGHQASEQSGLDMRDKACQIAFVGDPSLQGRHFAPFPTIDHAHRTARQVGVRSPFLGVDVHQVDDAQGAVWQIENVTAPYWTRQ